MKPIYILERNGQKTDAGIWDKVLRRDDGEFVELSEVMRIAEFNTSQPRDKGGKWTSAGDTSVTSGQRQELIAVAESRGFPTDRVQIIPYTKKFNIGGVEHTSVGNFSPDTGMVTLNQSQLKFMERSAVRGILAHEISHAEFNEAITNAASASSIKTYLNKNRSELVTEDGATNYSRSYWNAFHQTKASYTTAVNETLAEISRLHHTKPDELQYVAPVWTRLAEMVQKAGRK